MANTSEEYGAMDSLRHDIANADDAQQAMSHAYDGIGTVLIAILDELREIRELLASGRGTA